MKIAILMSTYNGHRFLFKQLQSLANQTVVDKMTVYIRDDGSSDDTISIINSFKEKLNIVLFKDENFGPALSFWNLLMNLNIKADYYAFCDQDDIWDEDKIEKGIERLTGNVNLYACNCRIIDENDLVIKKKRLEEKPNMNLQDMFISGFTQGCSIIFTNKLCKYIREANISCIPMHDLIVMLYARCIGEIYWDSKPYFSYRVHSNNVVAKERKRGIQKLKSVVWNWKNNGKNSMAIVAEELLSNVKELEPDDIKYLMYMKNYKKNIVCKWKVLLSGKTQNFEKKSLRSYRIRILLNLL